MLYFEAFSSWNKNSNSRYSKKIYRRDKRKDVTVKKKEKNNKYAEESLRRLQEHGFTASLYTNENLYRLCT